MTTTLQRIEIIDRLYRVLDATDDPESTDRARLGAVRSELSRLIRDLHQAELADRGRKEG